jgi:transcription elongation factor Elf1
MPTSSSKGRCYVCGKEFTGPAMRNHIVKAHSMTEEPEECLLLKVEGTYDKKYWLYLDMPKRSALSRLDNFLRKIWLECCGHMSEFHINYSVEIPMNIKIGELNKIEIGPRFEYLYDYGSTTHLSIAIMGEIRRPKQKGAVRLLARNNPAVFTCMECGKPAAYVCTMYECGDDAFFCEQCGDEHEHGDTLLPVADSPRMGVCGYCGEQDHYGFEIIAAL